MLFITGSKYRITIDSKTIEATYCYTQLIDNSIQLIFVAFVEKSDLIIFVDQASLNTQRMLVEKID